MASALGETQIGEDGHWLLIMSTRTEVPIKCVYIKGVGETNFTLKDVHRHSVSCHSSRETATQFSEPPKKNILSCERGWLGMWCWSRPRTLLSVKRVIRDTEVGQQARFRGSGTGREGIVEKKETMLSHKSMVWEIWVLRKPKQLIQLVGQHSLEDVGTESHSSADK